MSFLEMTSSHSLSNLTPSLLGHLRVKNWHLKPNYLLPRIYNTKCYSILCLPTLSTTHKPPKSLRSPKTERLIEHHNFYHVFIYTISWFGSFNEINTCIDLILCSMYLFKLNITICFILQSNIEYITYIDTTFQTYFKTKNELYWFLFS